ncbi:hypothetical protein [Aquibium microcysteis]|uniref:hypothetical protein n=1 Tax=Aquibium microcysteis TaxID=675281 RepID=UPI00165D1E2C|nr:hypothetical protein [Aquibium microcysteis]
MAGIERTDPMPPNRQGRPSDHEPAREDNRKGRDLSGRFGTGGTPFREGSAKGRDHLQSREKAFAQALRANEARSAPDARPGAGEAPSEGRAAITDAGRRNGRSDRGNAEEEAGLPVLLARAGPESAASGGRSADLAQSPSADLAQRIESLARRIGDQIDAQLRVNLIGSGDGGFRLSVTLDDPALALKSIVVQGDGDVLSVNLRFAEDMLDRETLATLAGQLATTLATRFPRRTIEVSGLPVGSGGEDESETMADAAAPTGLSALFSRR